MAIVRTINPGSGKLSDAPDLNKTGAAVGKVLAATAANPLGVGFVDLEGQSRSRLDRIVARGDSITAGNIDGTGITYPNLLEQSLGSKVTVLNMGQGGFTSTEVAITAGAVDPAFAAFTIPTTTTSVDLTLSAPTADYRAAGSGLTFSWVGVIAGVPGTLTRKQASTATAASAWTFTRATAGSSTSVAAGSAFHCTQDDDKTDALTIIDVGRNNDLTAGNATVLADVAAMVAHLSPTTKRYLVLGITTRVDETTGTAQDRVVALNTALAAVYGNRFIDVRGYLRANGLPFNELTATGNDTSDLAGGTIPRQLMYSDLLHPNQYGFRAMAKAVLDKLAQLGWILDAIAPVSRTAPPNLYGNGGFETGSAINTSHSFGAGNAAVTPYAAHSGLYGYRAKATGTLSNPVMVFAITLPAAEQTLKHSCSVWMRPSKQITVTGSTSYYDAGFAYVNGDNGSATVCPANVWTKVTVTGSYTPTTLPNFQFGIACGAFSAGDFVEFDDVSVVSGTVAP